MPRPRLSLKRKLPRGRAGTGMVIGVCAPKSELLSRGQRLSMLFADDPVLARGVKELADAVDRVQVPFVEVSGFLDVLVRERVLSFEQLASLLAVDAATVTTTVVRMQELGLAAVCENEDVTLTADGRMIAQRL